MSSRNEATTSFERPGILARVDKSLRPADAVALLAGERLRSAVTSAGPS